MKQKTNAATRNSLVSELNFLMSMTFSKLNGCSVSQVVDKTCKTIDGSFIISQLIEELKLRDLCEGHLSLVSSPCHHK